MKRLSFLILILFPVLFTTSCAINQYYLGAATEKVYLYDEPGSKGIAIDTIQAGEAVLIKKADAGLVYVVYRETEGWVRANSVVYGARYSAKRYAKDVAESKAASSGSPSSTSASAGYGGSVQVKGYHRKDGTYVQPHTRSAPRRH